MLDIHIIYVTFLHAIPFLTYKHDKQLTKWYWLLQCHHIFSWKKDLYFLQRMKVVQSLRAHSRKNEEKKMKNI